MNSDSNSNIQLPTGVRFCPTEYQLIEYYLIPKVMGSKPPLASIMDLDVYKFDPDQLPLNHFEYVRKNEAYFFIESTEEGDSIRATPSGYWKRYKENVSIFQGNIIIGFKNKFVFYNGSYPNGDETSWKIAEYRCTPSVALFSRNNRNWVVCKVRNKINVEEEAYQELPCVDEEEEEDNNDNH